jgi:hypothetical protein
MEYLRSCYSVNVWSIDAGTPSPDSLTIGWYFCPPGALHFPHRHQYGSLNYTKGVMYNEEVGETIGGIRAYSRGTTPPVVGNNFCGDPTAYVGPLPLLTVPQPINEHGIYACCNDPGVICSHCIGGFGEPNMPLVASGATGVWTWLNGTHVLPTSGDSTCQWQLSIPGHSITLRFTTFWDIEINNTSPLANASYEGDFFPGWDCMSQVPFTLHSSTQPGAPGTILVG